MSLDLFTLFAKSIAGPGVWCSKPNFKTIHEIAYALEIGTPWWPAHPGSGDRGTGRTTRMLLIACFHVLKGTPVSIVGHNTRYGKDMAVLVSEWTGRLGGNPRLVRGTNRQSMPLQLRGISRDTKLFIDHHVLEFMSLPVLPLGFKWANRPTFG